MECREADNLLDGCLLGELSDRGSRLMTLHLEACLECVTNIRKHSETLARLA